MVRDSTRTRLLSVLMMGQKLLDNLRIVLPRLYNT